MHPTRSKRCSQSTGTVSTRSARGSDGAASRAAASASSENDDRSGGASASRQNELASSATAAPVSRSRPGEGLISTLHAIPWARAQRAIAASVGNGSPAYFAECQPPASSRDNSRHTRASARPRRAGGPVERRVVQQKRNVVGCELDVEFDHAVTMRMTDAHRGQRVLRSKRTGATMRHEPWIGPDAGDGLGHDQVTRAPVAVSKR